MHAYLMNSCRLCDGYVDAPSLGRNMAGKWALLAPQVASSEDSAVMIETYNLKGRLGPGGWCTNGMSSWSEFLGMTSWYGTLSADQSSGIHRNSGEEQPWSTPLRHSQWLRSLEALKASSVKGFLWVPTGPTGGALESQTRQWELWPKGRPKTAAVCPCTNNDHGLQCENILKPNASKCMPHRTVQEKDPENYHDLILMESNNNDLLDPSLGIPWILRSTPPPIAPLVPHPHGSPHSADKRCSDELSPPQPWGRVVPHLPEYLLETGTKSNMIGQWCNEVNFFSFDGMRFTLKFLLLGSLFGDTRHLFRWLYSSGLGINHTLLYLQQVPCLCCATCIICCLKIPTQSCS